MFNKVTIDLLFNLLLNFVALFFLAFVMVSEKKQKEEEAINDNNILITMRWKANNDMDLHLKLPDDRRVWYANRDEPPAHLDVDVVAWRSYSQRDGTTYTIELNEEIITIRDVLEGEYVVNVHYYSAKQVPSDEDVEVEIVVQDVKNKRVIYADKKLINMMQRETHFVRFTVESAPETAYLGQEPRYLIRDVFTDRPLYYIREHITHSPDRNYDPDPPEEDYYSEEDY